MKKENKIINNAWEGLEDASWETNHNLNGIWNYHPNFNLKNWFGILKILMPGKPNLKI